MAFRTQCPSCGTHISVPESMYRRELKCPNCSSSFIAEMAREDEAEPAGGPGVVPKYFCKVCNAGFVEEDILDGVAVRRFNEVYCRRHFLEQFTDECEKHPGTKALTQCGRCGAPLCVNCVVELQDEEVCSRCKRMVLGELRGDYEPGEAFTYGDRPGLPWEKPGAGLEGLLSTVRQVLFSPGLAFAKMRVRGGYGNPMLFVLLLSAPFTWISMFWWLLIFGEMPSGFGPAGKPVPLTGGILVGYMFASIVGALIAPFVTAAFFHVCLLIVKGANRDYECTYRVTAFATGATSVFNIVPVIGGFATFIWFIIAMITGFSRAHGITGGRAALAFFLPLIVCCGGYAALTAFLVALIGFQG